MSGHGAPTLQVEAAGARVAIVASSWHDQVMDGLVAGAERALADAGVTDVTLLRAAGSFELPLVSQGCAAAGFDAVVALGCVIRGETYHFEVVSDVSARGVLDAGLRTRTAITNGVLTVENVAQAEARSGPGDDNKGFEAAFGAVELARVLANLG